MKIFVALFLSIMTFQTYASYQLPDFGPTSSEVEMKMIAQVNQGKMTIQRARPFFRIQDDIRRVFNNDLAFHCGKQAYELNSNIQISKVNQSDEFQQCLKDFASESLLSSGVSSGDIESIVYYYDHHMFVGTNNRVQFKRYWSNHKLIHSLIDINRKSCLEENIDQIYENDLVNIEYCTLQKIQKAVLRKIDRQDIDLGRELNDRIFMAVRAVI